MKQLLRCITLTQKKMYNNTIYMRLLELFSGTGSVGNVFREHGWDVVSLDRDMPADISTDILDWDYKNSTYPPELL